MHIPCATVKNPKGGARERRERTDSRASSLRGWTCYRARKRIFVVVVVRVASVFSSFFIAFLFIRWRLVLRNTNRKFVRGSSWDSGYIYLLIGEFFEKSASERPLRALFSLSLSLSPQLFWEVSTSAPDPSRSLTFFSRASSKRGIETCRSPRRGSNGSTSSQVSICTRSLNF